MKATQFFNLKNVSGNYADFHRETGRNRKRGVYFWGFTLRNDGELPEANNELVIYYIGKSEDNIVQRIMQEFAQLIFGGFGTLIDHNWLTKHPHEARIFNKMKSIQIDPDVIYKPEGLHVFNDFLTNNKIHETLDWMRERLIFAWIEVNDNNTLKAVENEMHHIVRTNVLGIHHMKNITPKKDVGDKTKTPFFQLIDWTDNQELRNWLEEVNKNIPFN